MPLLDAKIRTRTARKLERIEAAIAELDDYSVKALATIAKYWEIENCALERTQWLQWQIEKQIDERTSQMIGTIIEAATRELERLPEGVYEIKNDSKAITLHVNKYPPYKVPSMEEIKAIPWNGFSVASTFSGCGGSSLGYKLAGYRVLWASEFVDEAAKTYRANHRGTIVDSRDIRKVKAEDILHAIKMERGELDLFDGSPPCSAFSTAGKREAGWGKSKSYSDDKNQIVDDLFFEYIRLIDGIQPKVFVAENVSGLVKGTAKGYFLNILAAMKACGYQVSCRVLDAQWLGVPQMRQRTIFVGVRNDLNKLPAHPKPLPFRYSVRDALPHIVHHGAHVSHTFTPEWHDSASKPTQTIMAGGPTGGTGLAETETGERRKFTIDELKRICAFPDDFVLTGSYSQQWERLGRAVPPVMMYYIAKEIRDRILNEA